MKQTLVAILANQLSSQALVQVAPMTLWMETNIIRVEHKVKSLMNWHIEMMYEMLPYFNVCFLFILRWKNPPYCTNSWVFLSKNEAEDHLPSPLHDAILNTDKKKITNITINRVIRNKSPTSRILCNNCTYY